jgi:membrane-associated protease RseP (regulator of RpoE activity)
VAAFVSLVAFIVLLLFTILFHEFGHFITAKWSGIKASKFFLGFGPTIWSTRRGRVETFVGPTGAMESRPETEFGIKAFPLGGFVRIVGMSAAEEVAPEDEPRSFNAAPRWKRAIVLSAGSITHFITGFVILFLILTIIGSPDVNHPSLTVDLVVQQLADGKPSPAALAGLKPGDKIVAIDHQPVARWDDAANTIKASANRQLDLTVVRKGERLDLFVKPALQRNDQGKEVGFVGVQPHFPNKRANPVAAIGMSGKALGTLVTEFFHRVPSAFSPHTLGLTGGKGPTQDRPFSIIGAGRLLTDLGARGDITDFLFLFVEISVFIGIFNLLPLPPLDGGHLIVLLIEKVRGKPVDQRALIPVMAVVVSVLLLLGLLLGYYDITAPIRLPGP